MTDYQTLSPLQLNGEFCQACEAGNLELVQYLLTSPELTKKGIPFPNIHFQNDYGFRWACQNGHLEVVQYLLTSPEVINAGHTHPDIHACNDQGFRWACQYSHLDLVQYLVSSPDLSHHIDVNDNLDAFVLACFNNRLEVVKYIIFEANIDMTEDISIYLSDPSNMNKIGNEQVLKMFEARESYISLNNSLPNKLTKPKKSKI